MKTKKVLLFASIAVALAGCSNDEFLLDSNNGDNGGSLNGKLVDAGLLAMQRGGEGLNTGTRALSPEGNFVWMPEVVNVKDGTIGLLNGERSNQKVGLCWTGRNLGDPDFGATQTLTQNVYTNYEFEHVGWLDVDATVPSIVECSENDLDNGAYIIDEGKPEANFEGTLPGLRYNGYYYSDVYPAKGSYNETDHPESTGELNLGKGLFRTGSQTVFEGEYLVYFPYTDAFTRGPIIANQPTEFDVDAGDDDYKNASRYAFCLGRIEQYSGGAQVSKLETKTLSSYAIVNLYNHSEFGDETSVKIKKVILYSPAKQLMYENAIKTDQSISALNAGKNLDSKGLFIGGNYAKYTNAIYANLTTQGTKNLEYLAVDECEAGEEMHRIVFPILPQDVEGEFSVILIDDKDQSVEIPWSESKSFASNMPVTMDINLYGQPFTNNYVAVDEESLYSALEKIKTNGSKEPAYNANRIKMLNDITLENEKNMDNQNNSTIFFDKNIELYSDYDETRLILNTGKRLYIKSQNKERKLTVNVNVEIMGRDCCGSDVAMMSVGGASGQTCNVDFNKTVKNEGTLALGNDVTGTASAVINVAKLENVYDEWSDPDETGYKKDYDKNAATLYLVGGQEKGNSKITIDELSNEGRVKSRATFVTFGKNSVTEEERNQTRGERVVKANVGTLTNSGEIYIDFRTQVDVTTKLTNVDENSLIEIEGKGFSATVDGNLYITATSLSNAGTMDNRGVVNFVKAPLTNTGLFIDRTNGQLGAMEVVNGTRAGAGTTTTKKYAGTDNVYTTDLNVEGIYVAQVETDDRFRFVMTDPVVEKSTVIVEVLKNGTDKGGANVTTNDAYYLSYVDPNNKLQTKDVYIKTDGDCRFRTGLEPDEAGNELSKALGDCVTVFENASLKLPDGIYTAKNITVNKGARAETAKTGKLNVSNNFELAGGFTSNGIFDIKNVIVKATGEFDSNGNPNVAENFTTSGTVTFAANTTTTINGWFTSNDGGTFTRESLGNDPYSRATVNANDLNIVGGECTGGWPTRF